MLRTMRMALGGALRWAANFVLPNYWVCADCGNVEWQEREAGCWSCGIGEMVYQGR